MRVAIIHSDGGAFVIPNWRVVDIDDHDDWKRAELVFVTLESYLNE
ncbi:hypothetical protein OAI28_03640 [Methylophilaceae bacterium]|jgi:pseudaminic acid cytidylyltransferase|nr:hypothetical protein [Methylophilaceae bacterium]|tara:strand:- start:291 stop:428 length:138 start_codon:yes stop_codon:yes gene_type:complete